MPRRRFLRLVSCLLASGATVPAVAAADDCPGAAPACAYTGVPTVIGQRGGGVLRFPQTVAVGPDGAVYVGDQASHVVQVFGPDGVFQREVGFAGTRPGEFGAIGAIAVAPDNTLLVADGRNRIDRFDAAGQLIGSFGRSGDGVGEFHFGAGGGNDAPAGGGLAVLGSTLFVSDSRNDRIQRFSLDGSNGVVIVPPGLLSNPRGLAVRGPRLIVADDLNHRLVAFDTGGRQLAAIGAGRGQRPGQLDSPFGVAFDPRGRVFVADDLNHRVVRFSTAPVYPYKARWGSYGTGLGRLAFPRGIATDAAGAIYVTNTGNDRIDVYDANGTLRRAFGTSGRGPDQFDGPSGVAADASGIRAVTDSVNGRIKLLRPDGSVAAIWGSPAPGPTIVRHPVAVAFDPAGDAFVLDEQRAKVVVFDRATGLPRRSFGALGSGPGQLLEPAALALDEAGNSYVADSGNRRIARFGADGAFLGSFAVLDTPRGIAVTPDGKRLFVSDARSRITVYDASGETFDEFGGVGVKLGKLAAPAQMAVDPGGNLWVADRGHNRIQQFGPEGERLQMFGTRGIGPGQFISPTGVSVDCRGTLTVTDEGNNRVQQFALAAPAATTCAALPEPATPPPPKIFSLPLPLGPQVTLKILRTHNLLTMGNLPLRASCDTGCTIAVTATVSQRGTPRKGRRRLTVALPPVTLGLPAAESRIVRLLIPRTTVLQLRKALGPLRGLAVNVQLTATAPAGEPTIVTSRLNATR